MPDWEEAGFASIPESFTATGTEIVLRAFSKKAKQNREAAEAFVLGGDSSAVGEHVAPYQRDRLVRRKAHGASLREGACLFVPSFGLQAGPIRNGMVKSHEWSGAFLERHLNAFIFGNDYSSIATFLLAAGTPYRIGPIGQSIRRIEKWVGEEKKTERNWSSPDAMVSTDFRQVTIPPASVRTLTLLMEHDIVGLPAMTDTRH